MLDKVKNVLYTSLVKNVVPKTVSGESLNNRLPRNDWLEISHLVFLIEHEGFLLLHTNKKGGKYVG